MAILTTLINEFQCLRKTIKHLFAFKTSAVHAFFAAFENILFSKYLLNDFLGKRQRPDFHYLYKFHLIGRHPLMKWF